MSRGYAVEVMVRGIPKEVLRDIMTNRFLWLEIDCGALNGVTYFVGRGCLSGGESEAEAHRKISEALKGPFPRSLVCTDWTYLDERPHAMYGDQFDGTTPLPAQEDLKGGAEKNG